MATINKFTGVNNIQRPEECPAGDLQVANNVIFWDDGGVERRMCSESILSASGAHSLYGSKQGLLGVSGTTLYRYVPADASTDSLRTGLVSGLPMSYLEINDSVYYANGSDSGVVQNGASRSWGLAVPPRPAVTGTSGDMVPGVFQVALTYVRSDGQESGTSVPVWADAPGGGVAITGIVASGDPDVVGIAVYITATGGEIMDGKGLYRQGVLPNANASVAIRQLASMGGARCLSFNMAPPPAGDLLAFFHGRVYIVKDRVAWYTQTMAYELVQRDLNYLPFESHVNMFSPVENGIWVGTDKNFMFLSGRDPQMEGGFQIRSVVPVGVARGAQMVASSDLSVRGFSPGKAVVFVAEDGVYAGDGNGVYSNLTRGRWKPPTIDGIYGHIDRTPGKAQFIFGLRGGVGTGSVEIGGQVGG